ncbi:MAG: hypothetical protein ABJC61_05065 [Acidobacteriota bacterium]
MPPGIGGQLRALSDAADLDPAVRRVATASARFDRSYFVFLESARRALPDGARGVALFAPGADESAFYLSVYQFAPLPVRLNPPSVSPGWLAAVYGAARPAGWRVLRELPGGVLMQAPPAGPGEPPR